MSHDGHYLTATSVSVHPCEDFGGGVHIHFHAADDSVFATAHVSPDVADMVARDVLKVSASARGEQETTSVGSA